MRKVYITKLFVFLGMGTVYASIINYSIHLVVTVLL